MKITVYHIGPTCVQCNQTKKQMDKLGIIYNEVDLREYENLATKFREAGYLTAPIVTADETIWSGFKLERIKDVAMKLRLGKAHG